MKTTNLRIPDKQHKALKQSAEQSRRSMNAEILRAIEFYLKNKVVGQQMSNVFFNWTQQERFTEDERRMMKELQTKWDDAR